MPTHENKPPLLNEVVAKGAFLLKVHSPIYAAVHAVMLSNKTPKKQHCARGRTNNEGQHHLV